MNFADFVYNSIDDWYKLAIVIGCIEVKGIKLIKFWLDSFLEITIRNEVLREMYKNVLKYNDNEMEIRKFI